MEVFGLPIIVTTALFGLGGACVFAMISPDRKSVLKATASILVGSIASLALTPAICEWVSWDSFHNTHATAFGIGLVGNPLCRFALSEGTLEMLKNAALRLFNLRNGDGPRPPKGPREKHPQPDSDVL